MMSDQGHSPPQESLTTRVIAVSKCVQQINPIRQSAGEFFLDISKAAESIDTALDTRPARVEQVGNTLNVRLGYIFSASVSSEKIAPEQIGRVLADFVVSYELNHADEINPKVLVAFGEINGRLNTFPSWREYLNNCLVRGGFPSLSVPPFNAGKALRDLEARSSTATGGEPGGQGSPPATA